MWKVEYLREVLEDIKKLDQSQRAGGESHQQGDGQSVAPDRLRQALGNKGGTNLAGYCKIKLVKLGLRVIDC